MHEEIITTTSGSPSKFNTIINSTSLHQSRNDDGTLMVSIVQSHPQNAAEMGDFIGSPSHVPCSSMTNQIVSSQTKLALDSNELLTLKEDMSTVLLNGTISNSNDPNVLILPATETCDNDKNTLNLSQLTSSQVEHVEIDLHDVNSVNDETSGEGESSTFTLLPYSVPEIVH